MAGCRIIYLQNNGSVAYRMAPMLVTLNDPEGNSPVAGLSKCNPSNIYAACSLALAKLLVYIPLHHEMNAKILLHQRTA